MSGTLETLGRAVDEATSREDRRAALVALHTETSARLRIDIAEQKKRTQALRNHLRVSTMQPPVKL